MGAVPDAGAHGLSGWPVLRLAGSAGELHARPLADGRLVEVLEVTAPALALGSAQPFSDAREDAGVDVVRRRTGGGAVLLVPGECTWVDVTIPADDQLHDHDVARAFHWLGGAWAGALRSLGLDDVSVHTEAPVTNEWSSRICFAGVGAGEVLIGGRKVVGLSQRRTRSATRFQSVVFRRWDPDVLLALLTLEDVDEASSFLRHRVATVDAGPDALISALLPALP